MRVSYGSRKKLTPTQARGIAAFLALQAVSSLAGGLLWLGSTTLDWLDARSFEAEVVAVRQSRSSSSGSSRSSGYVYTPIFLFEDLAGDQHRLPLNYAGSPAPYDVGDEVDVLWQKGWTSVWADTFLGVFGLPLLITVAFGLFPLGLAYVVSTMGAS